MGTNYDEFVKELDAENLGLAERELVKLQKAIAIEALSRIIQRTPVDTGRARGNWQLTIAVVPSDQVNRKDTNGTETLSANISKLAGLQPYQVVYITNNVEYINILEEGGFVPPNPGPSKDPRKGRQGRVLVENGFSVQAPQGMVKVTLVELNEIFP